MRQEELTIERLSKSGDGVGHLGGRSVFVDGVLPGERVKVNITEIGRVLRGELVEIVKRSADRRTAACAVADRCGGCDWLHVSEQVQRAQKVEIVLSALEHLGGFDRAAFKLLPTIESPKSLGYRRRAVIHPVGQRFGYFRRGSHDKIEVDRCPALTKPLQSLPTAIAELLGTAINEVDQAHLLEAGGSTAVSLHLKGAVKAKSREKAEAISRTGIGVVLVPTKGQSETFGKVELLDGEVRVRPDAFVQANAEVNAKLVTAALEALALDGTQSVLELYSGNGNFTFAIARHAAQVLAVESSPLSMQLAQKAAGGAKNVRFVQGDALKILDGLSREGRRFDRVLVDPPRTGAPGLGKWVARLSPARLVYVACDPAALARDAEQLVSHGFRALTLQLFDLFPQTRHVEAVLTMER